ncbi:MAG: NAD(P)/FAD-dependent oxidoreductase [bacterium]|nr:NAD(P)/FAD-dependent oxidoreductase [bacterium]
MNKNENNNTNETNPDVIICGAGPAGLSTAIFCVRNNMNVLVLEKASITGSFPRGETVRPDPILEELLGEGFMNSISTSRTAERRYYSPGATRSFSLTRSHESYLFHWRDLTEGLRKEAEKAGAVIKFNTRVTSPILKDGICVGLETAGKNKYGTKLYANTIVAADGYNSCLGLVSGVDYSQLNCPVIKRICTGVESDFSGMEFFFVTRKSLRFAPNFPAGIAFIFPHGGGEAEVGFMVLKSGMSKKERKQDWPTKKELIHVFDEMTKSYPVFSDKLKNAKIEFEGVSILPMAGMHKQATSIPGLLLMGDSIGLVEASGGCGVVASMKNALFIADFLNQHNGQPWDKNLAKKMNKDFKKSFIYNHIEGQYKKLIPGIRLAFGKLGSGNRITSLWKLFDKFYRRV